MKFGKFIMSRIDKNPIIIPEKTEVIIKDNEVFVKGSKGELKMLAHPSISLSIEEGNILIKKINQDDNDAIRGLTKALITNMVNGVNSGFAKKLELEGVGYRVALSGNKLVMQLGFSHPVEIEAPKGITFTVEKNAITVSGIDRYLVGQTAANIRKLKKPEPYKGKGIRYEGEIIRRKEGKKAAKSA